MNGDETNEQQEQPKKGVVGRVNDAARHAENAYKLAKTARHPLQSLNAFKGKSKRKPAGKEETGEHPTGEADDSKKEEKRKRSIGDYSSTARNIIRVVNLIRSINPATLWAIVGVIIVILLVVILQGTGSVPNPFGGNDNDNSGQPGTGGQNNLSPIPGLTIGLDGPVAVGSGGSITYSISVSYDEKVSNIPPEAIIVFDVLPANTTLESATPPYILNGNTVEWKLSDVLTLSPFKITLKPTKDVFVLNTISARTTVDTASGPPSADNCSGTYNLSFLPNKLNFGDPKCNFTKDQLYTLLQQNDPTNADLWYKIIIPCESGYNPNAYNPNSSSTLGAFGLFQMNPKGQGSSQFDAGNVDWPEQVPNAISHNRLHFNDFTYWACAP